MSLRDHAQTLKENIICSINLKIPFNRRLKIQDYELEYVKGQTNKYYLGEFVGILFERSIEDLLTINDDVQEAYTGLIEALRQCAEGKALEGYDPEIKMLVSSEAVKGKLMTLRELSEREDLLEFIEFGRIYYV